jgi:hypothetical protein
VVTCIPDSFSKRAAVEAPFEVRDLVGNLKHAKRSGSVSGVIFTGHRTKQLI